MAERRYTNRRGETISYYFYEHPRDTKGKRPLTKLGTDFAEAKKKWAELEGLSKSHQQRIAAFTLAMVYDRYMRWANDRSLSNLEPRTIRDREQYWKELGKAFGQIPMDKLEPTWMLGYFEKRSAKTSAKKEIKFLSTLCNWARARGYMHIPNPVTGTTRQMPVSENRTIYVTNEEYALVHECGDELVRNVLDFAYLCGLRPAEALSVQWSDVRAGELHIRLTKTRKRGVPIKRIPVEGTIKRLLDKIRSRPIIAPTILADERGRRLSQFGTFRYRFRKAQDAAEQRARERGIPFQRFQFRDLRAKSGTDKEEQEGMEATRRFLGHSTEKQTRAYVRNLKGERVTALRTPKSRSDLP